jgi:ubiquinone/menaquinone biosynthesis C-methylase UbiE
LDLEFDMLKQAGSTGERDSTERDSIQSHGLALPFQDNVFDGCRSERLFMHLEHPDHTLA